MGHRPVITTVLWAIHINKEAIISPSFMSMGHKPLSITGLWAIDK